MYQHQPKGPAFYEIAEKRKKIVKTSFYQFFREIDIFLPFRANCHQLIIR